jgi:hypothetical protein
MPGSFTLSPQSSVLSPELKPPCFFLSPFNIAGGAGERRACERRRCLRTRTRSPTGVMPTARGTFRFA